VSETAVKVPATQRRRSERVSASIPVSIHGTDLLGQPFSERTTTINFNLHGCRYTSRHQLPKNSWVTVELPPQAGGLAMRARVVWIQKPHSIRDYFQVAIELESPANIWGLENPPGDWEPMEIEREREAEAIVEIDVLGRGEAASRPLPANLASYIQELVAHMTNESPAEFPEGGFTVVSSSVSSGGYGAAGAAESEGRSGAGVEMAVSAGGEDHPLLRSASAEIERRAKEAVESAAAHAQVLLEGSAQTMVTELARVHEEQAERAARMAAEREDWIAARERELEAALRARLEERLDGAREMVGQLEARAESLRAEAEAAQEASSRLAQARLQMEAAETAYGARQRAEETRAAGETIGESALEEWRTRLASEMGVAQGQWNELLQSSLDAGLSRLIAQVADRSQQIQHESERGLAERFGEMQGALQRAAEEAARALAGTKAALEEEVARAGFSLAEIEHSTARIKEYSAQLEAASHDSLNGLHRRLEKILEDQTSEMSRRAEGLAAGLIERTGPALEALSRENVERAAAQVEQLVGPHQERAGELIRELKARELQGEDSLRLHRERLRQISEQSQREAGAQMSSTVAGLRADFESARKEALAKWGEELEASGVRASHAAAESIGRTSEWFQQETRARLQVQVEQALASSSAALDEKFAHHAAHFDAQLEEKSAAKSQQIEARLEEFAGELVGRSKTQIEAAAEAAASSFGQVVQEISGKEMEFFSTHSHAALEERILQLEHSAQRLLKTLETTVATSLDGFQGRMSEQLEQGIARGREQMAGEFASAIEQLRADRAAHQREWAESLEAITSGAAGRFEERLQTSADSFVVASVRRLNEHGQNSIESLLRSGEQALRDSFSQVFEGMATILRERSTNAASVSGFAPAAVRENSEPPLPRNEASGYSAGA